MNGLDQDRLLLHSLCEFAGLLPSRLASEAGLAATTILRPFNGTATTRLSAPTIDKLRARFPDFPGWRKYAGGTGASDDRIPFSAAPEAGDGDRLLPLKRASTRKPAQQDDAVEIAEIDLRFGLGGAFMDHEIVEHQARTRLFPRAWLRMITSSPVQHLYWAQGVGDSMEPKISDGDVILIDRSQTDPSFGDLYWAIAYGQTGMIKRLRPMPDGSVKILSDNPNVPPETAYDGELAVFGRVVAVVKRV